MYKIGMKMLFLGRHMSEKNVDRAVAYYRALNNKDLVAMERYLHPDVQLIGPLANASGKEAVINTLRYFISAFTKLTIRAQFGSGDQVMLAYDVDFPAPIGVFRAAVLLTFQDGLIIRYELFFDSSPFETK